MKRILKLCCVYITFGVSRAYVSAHGKIESALDANLIDSSNEIRDLGTGGIKTMKKLKIKSNKDKLSKNDSKAVIDKKKAKVKGKGKGKGTGNGDGEYSKKGKGMTKMKGMMKGKSAKPIAVETPTPSTTMTPVAVTSPPVAPIPTASPKTTAPIGFETESPIVSSIPSPVAIETEAPSITGVPSAITAAPMVLRPSTQPILVSPTNFAFIGTSNILVRYESSNSGAAVTLNQTMEAIDLTCDYIRNEAIIPLGALEFACIWFLPPLDENGLTFFPLEITYAGTAAFPSDTVNVTTEILDASIITVLSPPMVGNLTEIFNMELPSDNPFSQTEEIYAVV